MLHTLSLRSYGALDQGREALTWDGTQEGTGLELLYLLTQDCQEALQRKQEQASVQQPTDGIQNGTHGRE
jgi:hypothetical protein